jgi:hypothetical protein
VRRVLAADQDAVDPRRALSAARDAMADTVAALLLVLNPLGMSPAARAVPA